MLEYDRIDVSERIDINKTNASKEYDTCHYWYFKDVDFKYEPYLCNCCRDLMQKAMNSNNVAIVSIKGSDYRIYFWYMSKSDAINIMKKSNLNEKGELLLKKFIIHKNEWTGYYQRNRETILNRAKNYYENNKEVLREKANDKYRELSEGKKNIKKEHGRNRYKICLKKRNKD